MTVKKANQCVHMMKTKATTKQNQPPYLGILIPACSNYAVCSGSSSF